MFAELIVQTCLKLRLEESSGMQLEAILKAKGSENESTPNSCFTLEDANQ